MLGQSSVGSVAAKIIALKAKSEAAIKQIRGFWLWVIVCLVSATFVPWARFSYANFECFQLHGLIGLRLLTKRLWFAVYLVLAGACCPINRAVRVIK